MKKQIIIQLLTGLFLMPVVSSYITAQENNDLSTFSKDINEQHPANAFSTIDITNKHGNIAFTAWEKDSIRIDAWVTVKSTNSEEGEKVLDQITVHSSRSEGTLRFQTRFHEEFYSAHPFQIRYDVYLPGKHTIIANNQFGNVTTTSMTGKMDIDLKYGDLIQKGLGTIRELKGSFSFSDIQSGNLQNLNLHLSNTEINLDHVESADITGKYCQLNIASAGKLKINANTCRLKSDQIRDLDLIGTFCFASLGEIEVHGHIEINNGLLIIDSLKKELQKLSVKNNNAPVNLVIPEELSYTLHGEVTNGQFIHYHPQTLKIIKEMDQTSFSGSFQAPNQTGASIVLFNKNAGINIKR